MPGGGAALSGKLEVKEQMEEAAHENAGLVRAPRLPPALLVPLDSERLRCDLDPPPDARSVSTVVESNDRIAGREAFPSGYLRSSGKGKAPSPGSAHSSVPSFAIRASGADEILGHAKGPHLISFTLLIMRSSRQFITTACVACDADQAPPPRAPIRLRLSARAAMSSASPQMASAKDWSSGNRFPPTGQSRRDR
jgi:hypothetical protein